MGQVICLKGSGIWCTCCSDTCHGDLKAPKFIVKWGHFGQNWFTGKKMVKINLSELLAGKIFLDHFKLDQVELKSNEHCIASFSGLCNNHYLHERSWPFENFSQIGLKNKNSFFQVLQLFLLMLIKMACILNTTYWVSRIGKIYPLPTIVNRKWHFDFND